MKILVTGGHGQLGRSVVRRGRAAGHEVSAHGRDTLDLRDAVAIIRVLAEASPEIVVNAAAYTDVDGAERDREAAFATNAIAAGVLAREVAAIGARMLHVSTDHVFDGAAVQPYREDDRAAPLNTYGESKLAGERAVLAAGGSVVRTSWLFAARGPSFVDAIIRRAGTQPALRVVADQRGCPTWAEDLADALLVLATHAPGVYHYCNTGAVSRHAFALAIVDEARRFRALECERIDAVTTAELAAPARRPAYSVLSTERVRAIGIDPPDWRIGLRDVLAEALGAG